MCSVAPKLFYVVPDCVCIGWACDVAPKIVFLACGLGGFQLVSRWCVWVFLHLQCPDGVCIGWACALWLQSCFMWFQMVFA